MALTRIDPTESIIPSLMSSWSMRKRLTIIALAVGVVSALSIAIHLFRQEPRFQGKTSAEWFHDFCLAQPRYFIPEAFRIGGSNMNVKTLDAQLWQRDPSADGLRGLGTNAALFLARQICRDEPYWHTAYRKVFSKLPDPVKSLFPNPPAKQIFARFEAVVALEALGRSDGALAVPLLTASLKNPDRSTRREIMRALQSLPRNAEETDKVLKYLARRGQFPAALEIISGLGLRTKGAAIVLSDALTSGNAETKMEAVRQLSGFGPAGAPAVPALIAALNSTDSELRYSATSTLADIGPGARAAVSDLTRLTNDVSPMVQHGAARALTAIGSMDQQ